MNKSQHEGKFQYKKNISNILNKNNFAQNEDILEIFNTLDTM
jgi:hypothetical protein